MLYIIDDALQKIEVSAVGHGGRFIGRIEDEGAGSGRPMLAIQFSKLRTY